MADLEVQEKDGKIYCPLKKAWHVSTPEERVRQYYIAILANKYGYSLEQMDQELKVNNSKRGQGKARADIVIWKSEQDKKDKKAAFIVVECKAENVKVRVEDYYQGFNYASWAHAEFFVTTNEKETKYFNVDPAYLPQKLDEVVAIPTAKDVDDAARIEQIKNQTKLFTRDEFTKTLRACHNIIRNNDKLSPEAAFDEISKLLFMKIRFERDNKAKIILICSIPQDVFIAAGATVKPSLVFMRRFTNDEESEYANCKSEALAEVTALHQAEIDKLEATIAKADVLTESLKDDLKKAQTKLKQAKKDKKNTTSVETEITTIKKEQADNRLNKKTAEKELKGLYKQIDEETKPVVKKKFDYDIPIAKIDDAGITTTGAASEGNQLPQLVDEYSAYRIQNNLWPVLNNEIIYAMNTDGKYCRYIGSQEVVLNEQ